VQLPGTASHERRRSHPPRPAARPCGIDRRRCAGAQPSRRFPRRRDRGAGSQPRSLPSKYLYDARGCELFERICALPDYYLARAEDALMAAHAVDIARLIGARATLYELGGGSGSKTRRLLRALHRPAGFMPVDLAPEQLERSARSMAQSFPQLRIVPVVADFTGDFELPPPQPGQGRPVVLCLGSTIGNFEPREAVALMVRVREQLGPGGAMLIGIDTRKDVPAIERAYDDSQGLTAAFNLNLLERINRELGADFDTARGFVHHSCWNARLCRAEQHLLSRCDQIVHIGHDVFALRRGESIHTVNSYKYTPDEFIQLGRQAGYESRHTWLDTPGRYALHFLVRGI
jgi:L-histidine N-alpha-methyltransferase